MKIGAIYPQIEMGGDPQALAAFARAADGLGYDYLALFEHVAGAVHENRDPPLWGPYTVEHPFHDPLVSFGYLAGITERIELVTGVLVLPQRQTLLVARQAADVDLFSGGRLRLGVGIGWNYVEYEALGQDFHRRGKRLSEQIVLLRRLWGESPMSFSGDFDRIDRAGLNPLPGRRIPIYCGGFSQPALRRAAQLADGFIFGDKPENVLDGWEALRGYLAEADRSAEGFGADYQLPDGSGVKATLDLLRRWRDAGGTHAGVRTLGLGFKEIQQHIDFIAEVRQRLES